MRMPSTGYRTGQSSSPYPSHGLGPNEKGSRRAFSKGGFPASQSPRRGRKGNWIPTCSMDGRLLVTFAATLAACLGQPSLVPPHILVLFADDMGYGDVGFTGSPTTQTPNLDRLAEEGVMFTQWYSGAPICSASRAALLTGRLPVRAGVAGETWKACSTFTQGALGGLPSNETTFGSVLQSTGLYRTEMIGKWHLGQRDMFLPVNHGFDHSLGIPFSHDMGCSWWKPNCTEPFATMPLPLLNETTIVEQPVDLSTLDRRYNDHALDLIRWAARAQETQTQGQGQRPEGASRMLLYYAFQHVHYPMYCVEADCTQLSARGSFGAQVQALDASVGELVGLLEDLGMDENTLIFFSSDNGPWLQQLQEAGTTAYFRGGKYDTWEGGLRVPAFVRWSGHIAPHQRSLDVVSTLDIFPTILQIAGVSLPDDRFIDGVDLTPLLLEKGHPRRGKGRRTMSSVGRGEGEGQEDDERCLFFYQGSSADPSNSTNLVTEDDFTGPGQTGLFAVRCGAYKAHYYTRTAFGPDAAGWALQQPPLLFQIEHDPAEAYAIDNTTTEYSQAVATISAATVEHQATLGVVPNQYALGDDTALCPCGDPQSQAKYPDLPNCTLTPETWTPFGASFPPEITVQVLG